MIFFFKKETLINKVYNELNITNIELSELLEISNKRCNRLTKGIYSNLIIAQLEQLILYNKNEKRELIIKNIKTLIRLEDLTF